MDLSLSGSLLLTFGLFLLCGVRLPQTLRELSLPGPHLTDTRTAFSFLVMGVKSISHFQWAPREACVKILCQDSCLRAPALL